MQAESGNGEVDPSCVVPIEKTELTRLSIA